MQSQNWYSSLCHILLDRSNHRFHTPTRSRDYTRAWKTGSGDYRGHPELCRPQIPKDRDPWSCLSLERDFLWSIALTPMPSMWCHIRAKSWLDWERVWISLLESPFCMESIQKFLDGLVKKLESNLLAGQSAYQRGYHTGAKWSCGQQQPRPVST